MARKPRDGVYASAFGRRLAVVLGELDISIAQLGKDLGYRDGSTLYAAAAGRCLLDVERLVRLSDWCQARGHHLNLHWLLTGECDDAKNARQASCIAGWLTPTRQAALKVLAAAANELPRSTNRRRRRRTAPARQR